MIRYRTLVVDPPWPQKGGGPLKGGHGEGFVGTTGSQPMPYRTMSIAEIKALRVADTGCHLYLWTTNGFLRDAFDVVKAWGFTFSTLLTWAKKPMGGGLGGAYGISSEYIIFARRGTLPALSRVSGTWFNWKRPYDKRGKPMHSGKPPEFFEMVETVSPGPRLEMFARRSREGWDSWGDQAPASVDLSALDGAA